MAAKRGIRRSWNWNQILVAIATELNHLLHFSFYFILIIPRVRELRPSKCLCNTVSLLRWPLTCDLEKCYSLISSLGMYNLERWLRYSYLLARYCPCNLLSEPIFPKHEYRGKLPGHPVTLWLTSSPRKILFSIKLGRSYHIWSQIETVFDISKISKWPPFWGHDKLFYTGSNTKAEYAAR